MNSIFGSPDLPRFDSEGAARVVIGGPACK